MIGPFAKDGSLTIGGFWLQPVSADWGYLQAARTLIDYGKPELVGLPVAYLQRHALELLLKAVIEIAWVIKWERDWVDAGRGSPRPPVQKPPRTHVFPQLLDLLKASLADLGHETPGDFDEVVGLFDELEAVEGPDGTRYPDRLRYDAIGPPKASFESFPKPVTIPLKKRQERLEALAQTHLRFPELPEPEDNFDDTPPTEDLAFKRPIPPPARLNLYEKLFWEESALRSTLTERGDFQEDSTPLEELE